MVFLFLSSQIKLFCYDIYFMLSFSHLDDLLSIDNEYFEHIVDIIYPNELELNKINAPDT